MLQRWRVAVAAAGIATLLGAAGYRFHWHDEPFAGGGSNAAPGSGQFDTPSDNRGRDDTIRELAATVAGLTARIDALERSVADNAAAAAASSRDPAPAAPRPPVVPEPVPTRQEPTSFDGLLQHAAYEPLDAGWARSMNEGLDSLAGRLPEFGLQGTALTHRDCRTTLCVVEFSHASEAERRQLPALLAVPGAAGASLRQPAGEPHRTIAIFTRDGYRKTDADSEPGM